MFSTGHPRQYSLAPAMLVCADRTRRGRFIAVWPQILILVSIAFMYPLPYKLKPPFEVFLTLLHLSLCVYLLVKLVCNVSWCTVWFGERCTWFEGRRPGADQWAVPPSLWLHQCGSTKLQKYRFSRIFWVIGLLVLHCEKFTTFLLH